MDRFFDVIGISASVVSLSMGLHRHFKEGNRVGALRWGFAFLVVTGFMLSPDAWIPPMFWRLDGMYLYSGAEYVKAKVSFEKAAAASDAASMGWLGVLYLNGEGITKNYATARGWF